ncbi:MAG: DUF5916 domain-containing protein [Fulvivirga sp.]|nr:DUF5916 domain-containing protein [Fulvivirga sp.]
MINIRTFLAVTLLSQALTAFAQVNADQYKLYVDKLSEAIVLDGKLTETHWQQADKAGNFILTFPVDSLPATSQTEMMVAFDDQYLYIAGRCYVQSDKAHVVQSLRRDFDWSGNDNMSIYIDPYDDYTNGFTFGITPYGVRREGLVTNGAEVSDDWDNKWFSEVHDFGDRWEFEMKIPFKTLRFDEDNNQWNIVFLRRDLKNNEVSTWSPVPQGYRFSSLAFSGELIFNDPLQKTGPNIAIIPYTSASYSNNFEQNQKDTDLNAGFDAKIGVSSSLNLDLTFNPDFSQVEVDRQVTNLNRFEIFFPERRQFFLENQDLFGEGGFPDTRPFFSRRIGIGTDTSGVERVQIPILYGARLSGKIGKDWRIGLMNMQTKRESGAKLTGTSTIDSTFNLLPQNYTVGVLQRRVLGRSNVGLIMVNRQSLDFDDNEANSTTTAYNRVIGVDYNLLTENNRWSGDFYYHRSFDPVRKDNAYSTGMFLGYNTRNLSLRLFGNSVGDGFNAETGFIQRKDIISMGTFNDYNFYPENSFLVRHGPGINFDYKTDLEFDRTDQSVSVDYSFTHKNTSNLRVRYVNNIIKLRSPFDPTGSGLEESQQLQEGEEFSWSSFQVNYETDSRRLISGELEISYGGFYNGKRLNANAEFNFRYQPYGFLRLAVDYNNLHGFPEPFQDIDFWLIGPRIDLTFTDKFFLTTFVQYNEQADNINLNARLQWRYKPVSDMFIVYTDNYFPDNFKTKSRAIVFKITYWLNI